MGQLEEMHGCSACRTDCEATQEELLQLLVSVNSPLGSSPWGPHESNVLWDSVLVEASVCTVCGADRRWLIVLLDLQAVQMQGGARALSELGVATPAACFTSQTLSS